MFNCLLVYVCTYVRTGRLQNPPQQQHTNAIIRGAPPVIGFVMESHNIYSHYIHDHMNVSHPLFARAIQRFTDKVFLNAGVFLMDAKRWRQQNMTARAEQIILENKVSVNLNAKISTFDMIHKSIHPFLCNASIYAFPIYVFFSIVRI